MRKGWKQWMDDGSPELTPEMKRKYKFDSRFLDDMLRVSWDTAFTYAAKAMIVIATRYSGEAGARRLREQGYAPEMIEMMKGAGVRCFKHRAGMPVLGIIGKDDEYPVQRWRPALAGHAGSARSIPDQAQGGRYWINYTWHGDQDPSQPWWNGTQNCDVDLSDMRFSKLNTSWGKNFVENKMPEAHWKLESIERGARIVVITPEYNPTAYRADYWIPLRPQIGRRACSSAPARSSSMRTCRTSTISRSLPICRCWCGPIPCSIWIRATWSRTTSSRISPRAIRAGSKSLKPEQIERLGGMMVWDLDKKQAVPLHREQVGWHYQKSGIDPALTGTYRVKLLNGREVDAMPVYQMYQVHFQDYDLDTVHQITRSPKDLLVRWARDSGTIKPAAIHNGEGVCHYFHMTANGPGGGAGGDRDGQHRQIRHGLPYLVRQLQSRDLERRRPGRARASAVHHRRGSLQHHSGSERPWQGNQDRNPITMARKSGYWNHGDTALIVNTPKYGRKVFTGKTHMPTPSKSAGSST